MKSTRLNDIWEMRRHVRVQGFEDKQLYVLVNPILLHEIMMEMPLHEVYDLPKRRSLLGMTLVTTPAVDGVKVLVELS